MAWHDPERSWENEAQWRQAQYREMALTPYREMCKWRRRFWLLLAFDLVTIAVAIAVRSL